MSEVRCLVVAAGVVLGMAMPVGAQVAPENEAAVAVAESFLRKLDAGDFTGAQAMTGPRLKAAGVSAEMLDASWKQLSGGTRLSGLRASAVNSVQGYQVVDVAARFGEGAQWFHVSIDQERRVEGFRVTPQGGSQAWEAPLYAQAEAFQERELTVGAEGWPLGATLTLPNGVSRAPVVVLVHGSGAHDRDETLGGVQPFHDLAWGLASNGVAVLRFEKRTWKHGPRMNLQTVTVDDEVIADALAVLRQVRQQPGIDSQRVFLLGHSLGGMLAPEIGVRDGGLAGVILLAGTPRSLPQVVLEQLDYLVTLPENAVPAAKTQIAQMRTTMERVLRHEAPPAENVGGGPASYFYDLEQRQPLEFLKRLSSPVLVLQGGRDYQVTKADYDLWQEALQGRSDARFRWYPDLNHLFVTGTGKATPSEYATSRGHVDARVIADIAAFAKQE